MERCARILRRRQHTVGRRMRQRWNGVPPERFSVRWTGFLSIGRSGLYNFATTSDDGSQLIIDNQLVVDNGGPHGLRTQSGSIHLDRGSHPITLRYVQYGATSALDWSWSRDGGDYSTVPAWALSQRRTSYTAVVTARIVDWGLWSLAILVVLVAAWYIRVGLNGEEVGRWAVARRLSVTQSYRNTACLVFSVFILTVTLFLPWRRWSAPSRAIETTARHLNRTAITMLGGFETFQTNINSPKQAKTFFHQVQEMLAMLRGHGWNPIRSRVPSPRTRGDSNKSWRQPGRAHLKKRRRQGLCSMPIRSRRVVF